MLDLQTHLWSPSLSLNAAYFEWKYERNPYMTAPLIYLAIHEGRLAGMRGFFGVQWEAGSSGQKFPALYADDAVVAPEHRQSGLMNMIMTEAFKDLAIRQYDYVVSLSAGGIMFRQSLSTGWRNAGWVQPMRRLPWRVMVQKGTRRISKALPLAGDRVNDFFSGWLEKKRRSLADIDEVETCARKIPPGISFEDQPRSQDMADLVERIGSSGKIRHSRDRKYFDWRFQNPLSRYRFLFNGKARLEGYLVLQEYTSAFENKEVLNIVDWEGTSPAVKAELLDAVFAYAVNRVLVIWSASMDCDTVSLLKSRGFRKKSQHANPLIPSVLIKHLHDGTHDSKWLLANRCLLDLGDWELRMLYSMHG